VKERKSKLRKSCVDDKFFSLAEMDAFCDAQERVEERERNLGEFGGSEEISSLIKELEEDNLKPKNWSLSGEVSAEERRKDELLQRFIDVDFRAKSAPEITKEVTDHIEEIIKKRIKDKLFDDVVRKVRVDESLIPIYRNETNIEQTVRKSLAEVYGDKMSDKINETEEAGEVEKLHPEVEAIKKDMDSLFKKLDALTHFQFKPPAILPEVKILKNIPSIRKEEAGPTAATEPSAMLLAPEEVFRHLKAAPKAKEERTETDKKRERRKKKNNQGLDYKPLKY